MATLAELVKRGRFDPTGIDHGLREAARDLEQSGTDSRLCECGCGQPVSDGYNTRTGLPIRYRRGHYKQSSTAVREAYENRRARNGTCQAIRTRGRPCRAVALYRRPDGSLRCGLHVGADRYLSEYLR